MSGKYLLLFAHLSLCCMSSMVYAAVSTNDLEVVKLKNGFNEIHFDGLDQKTIVAVAHRDNYDAHSYDVTTLYVDYKPTDKYDPKGLQLLPIIEKSGETHNLFTDGGADCLLDDYRIVRNKKSHETWLIVGNRTLGDSYADTESVNFIFYKLTFNKDQAPGSPPFSFEYWKELQTKKKYCDIEDAFQKELGLEGYRTDTNEDDQ